MTSRVIPLCHDTGQVWRVRRAAAIDGGTVGAEAVAALIDDPAPPQAFVRGGYQRLRVGAYRVMYAVDEDRITVLRVDRLA